MWKQISPYAIESGKYRVSKARVGGEWKYTVWRDGVMVVTVLSVSEAKDVAEKKGGAE